MYKNLKVVGHATKGHVKAPKCILCQGAESLPWVALQIELFSFSVSFKDICDCESLLQDQDLKSFQSFLFDQAKKNVISELESEVLELFAGFLKVLYDI